MKENVDKAKLEDRCLIEPAIDVAKSLQKHKWEDELWKKVVERFKKHGRGPKDAKGKFDIAHTKASVAWAKILGNLENRSDSEIEILTVVMMLHDTGYDFLHREGFVKYGDEIDLKSKHIHSEESVVLANIWRKEIKGLKDLTDTEWGTAIELIRDHDDKRIFEQDNYTRGDGYHDLMPLVFAADTLGQIDVRSGVIPSFEGDNLRNYLDKQLQRRGDILQGDHARKVFSVLKEIIIEKYLKT